MSNSNLRCVPQFSRRTSNWGHTYEQDDSLTRKNFEQSRRKGRGWRCQYLLIPRSGDLVVGTVTFEFPNWQEPWNAQRGRHEH
jgi:hypothetical protein